MADYLVTRQIKIDKPAAPMPEGPALTELRKEIARLEAETPRREKVPAFVPVAAISQPATQGSEVWASH